MVNSSGIEPRGHRVLVLPDFVEHKTDSGIILHTESQSRREEMAQTEGVVVAISDDAYSDQQKPWCKVGERVVFAKYSGLVMVGKDDKKYRLINDLDVAGAFNNE